MLWTLIGILIILWILGFSFDIAGGIVHLLLVIALIVLIFQMITGRKRS
ncbi:lmo0937 family membrane protein [Bacillus sp. CRN 9]|nr:lmo0937 family membrane protein [Bacillus sp. CRN 9]